MTARRPALSWRTLLAVLLAGAVTAASAAAQETAAEEAVRRKSALSTLPKDAARRLFGAALAAAPGEPRIVGEYWKGCYTGGVQLPAVGEHWQAMRLSRNRHWGHPRLIAFLERFSRKAAEVSGWPGILIGDMSQPQGGPMLTGHSSHQLGIEADIWLRPMPNRRWSPEENENVLSTDLVRRDGKDVDPKAYSAQHFAVLRAAAQQPEVARVFVNAAIKKALCRDAGRDAGSDRSWLRKVRPVAGHTYHFHIRLACPAGQTDCIEQAPPPGEGDGCGKDLDYWFQAGVLSPRPTPSGPGKSISLAAMPPACRDLVRTPTAKQ